MTLNPKGVHDLGTHKFPNSIFVSKVPVFLVMLTVSCDVNYEHMFVLSEQVKRT